MGITRWAQNVGATISPSFNRAFWGPTLQSQSPSWLYQNPAMWSWESGYSQAGITPGRWPARHFHKRAACTLNQSRDGGSQEAQEVSLKECEFVLFTKQIIWVCLRLHFFFLSQKKKKKEDNEAQPQPGSQAPIKADVKQIYSSTLPCFYVRLCFRGAHPSLRRLKWARFKRRPFFLP